MLFAQYLAQPEQARTRRAEACCPIYLSESLVDLAPLARNLSNRTVMANHEALDWTVGGRRAHVFGAQCNHGAVRFRMTGQTRLGNLLYVSRLDVGGTSVRCLTD